MKSGPDIMFLPKRGGLWAPVLLEEIGASLCVI